jgi:hypothetical protein
MAETIVEKNGSYADLQSRESSVFDPPTYEISYASDKTLKWDPPQGSKDLAVALSYYFPMERDLKSKMRAATRKFLKAEAKKELAKSKPNEGKTRQEEDLVGECVLEKAQVFESTPSRLEMESPSSAPTSSNSSTGVSISKPLAPGQSEFMVDLQKDNFSRKPVAAPMEILRWNPASEQSNRRKKRPYGNAERAKVAANRGNACEEHRRMKSKVCVHFDLSISPH